MTPAELKRGIEALRIKLKQLEHGERIAYWELLDALDHSNAELSKALDGELTRLQATGELVFVDDEDGGEARFVERRKVDRRKKPAAKQAKKAAPARKKKPAPPTRSGGRKAKR